MSLIPAAPQGQPPPPLPSSSVILRFPSARLRLQISVLPVLLWFLRFLLLLFSSHLTSLYSVMYFREIGGYSKA